MSKDQLKVKLFNVESDLLIERSFLDALTKERATKVSKALGCVLTYREETELLKEIRNIGPSIKGSIDKIKKLEKNAQQFRELIAKHE